MKFVARLVIFLALFSVPARLGGQERSEPVRFFHDIVIESGERAGDAVCFGCSIYVRGSLNGDAVAIGGGIEISGTASADAVSIVGNIRLDPGAKLQGDAVAVAGRVERHSEASIGGEVVSLPGLGKLLLLVVVAIAIGNLVLVVLSYFIAGEQRVEIIASTLREHGGLALLTGIGLVIGATILLIISSQLGPLMPVIVILVSLGLAITLLVGYTGMSSWLGRNLVQGSGPLAAVLVGAVLITLLQIIPVLGLLAFLIFVLLALGSAGLSGYGSDSNWLPERLVTRQPIPPSSPSSRH